MFKTDIFESDDVEIKTVETPEWAKCPRVFIRVMSGTDRDSFDGEINDGSDNFRSKLLVRCICNDKGERILDESDVAKLGKKSSKVIGRIYDVAAELNGIGAKPVEALAGNSESGRGAASPSA